MKILDTINIRLTGKIESAMFTSIVSMKGPSPWNFVYVRVAAIHDVRRLLGDCIDD
jgi:hypothetical protein